MRKRRPAPRARPLWTKLLVAIAAPVVFFALLEGSLRLGGIGRDTRFFIPDEVPGMWRTNPRFTELFFPASFGLKPANFRLPKDKPAGTTRIFVLGESAAMGVPVPAFGLAPQLQAQLRAARPGEQIEVFNLAVTAINSHVVREIAREAVNFQPDLLVIYMGNNEVVGPFGPGSAITQGMPSRQLIRAGVWLRSSRTGQLLQSIVGWFRPRGAEFHEWGGMEMFADRLVPADDPRLAAVYGNFAVNLAAILDAADDAGAKVVLSTVAVNVRDCAPFASVPSGEIAALAQAERAEALGRSEEAGQALQRTIEANPTHADARFRLARWHDAAGDMAAARREYLEALQWDALRFRADARINQLIREAKENHDHVMLVDAAQAFGSDAASTMKPAGADLFFEHVHLTWEGNFALARQLAEAADALVWGQRDQSIAWLDEAKAAEAVGFTVLGRLAQLQAMEELTGRPPFTGQSTFGAYRTRLEREIARVREEAGRKAPDAVRQTIATALSAQPENPSVLFQASAVRLQLGDFTGALELHERLGQIAPFSAEQAVQKAFLLQRVGRTKDAEVLLERAIKEEPYYFQCYPLLAGLWVEGGGERHAVGYFAAKVSEMPASRVVRGMYAQLLARTGDWDGAEREWREMLRRMPDDETALEPLASRLAESGRLEEAVDLMERAFARNPRNYANNARLLQVAESKGDPNEVVKYMQALEASGAVNAEFYREYAGWLDRLGQADEAAAARQKAEKG